MRNRGVQSGLALLIESVHKEKGIPKEMLIEVIEQAMCKAAKQWLRQKEGGSFTEESLHDIEARYNTDRGEVEIFEFKKIVEEGYWPFKVLRFLKNWPLVPRFFF